MKNREDDKDLKKGVGKKKKKGWRKKKLPLVGGGSFRLKKPNSK